MKARLIALSLGLIASVGVAAQTQDPVGPGPGITNPTLVREQKPKYTSEAMRAKIQGIVEVEAVVLSDGTVGTVRIHKSLDKNLGLDEAALAAAKGFLFTPALVKGQPIPFKVIIQLEFKLPVKVEQAPDEEFARVASAPDPGIANPTLIREQKPNYTRAALEAKIQGIVEVEAIILANGTVGGVRIHKSLDAVDGLDQEALAAAKLFLFKPAMKDGQPVPLRVIIQLEFVLGKEQVESSAFRVLEP